MDQIVTMEDEESGEELRIINASFADPYLLVLRDNSSVKLYKASGSDEVEDVARRAIRKAFGHIGDECHEFLNFGSDETVGRTTKAGHGEFVGRPPFAPKTIQTDNVRSVSNRYRRRDNCRF